MLGAINLFDDPLQLPALGRPLHEDFLSEIGPPAFLSVPLGDERAYNWGTADATGALNGGITTTPGGFGTLESTWRSDGATGYSLATIPAINTATSKWSLAVRINITETIKAYYDFASFFNYGVSTNGCRFLIDSANRIEVAAGGGGNKLLSNTVFSFNTWYDLLFVASPQLSLYVNGQLDISTSNVGTGASCTSFSLFAGFNTSATTTPSSFISCLIDFAGLWSVPLTAAQASYLHNCLLTGEPFPLFAPLATTRYFPLSAGGPQSVPLPTVDVAISAVAPTVTLGPVAPAAPAIDVVVSVIAPTISLGTVSQAAGTIDILLSVIAPAVTLGPPTIVVPTIDIAVSAIAPAITLGGVAETAGLADISLAPIAPTVALGPVLQSAPALSVAVDTSAPAISLGPAATAAAIASITLDASTPAVTLGSVSVAAPGLDVLIDVIAPATQVQAVPLSVVDLALAVVAPTPGFVGAYPTIDVWELSARDTVWILEP